MHRFLIASAISAHLAFIAFVVMGGFLAWAWPGLFWVHLAAVAWAVWVLGLDKGCPLTLVENRARRGAGLPTLPDDGFMAHYLAGRVYPVAWASRVPLLAFAVVGLSWVLLLLR